MEAGRLSGGRPIRIGGALALGVLAAALAVWAGLRASTSAAPLRLPGVGTAAFLEPVAHRFADPVEANVEAVVPIRRVDPRTLTVSARFSPYRVVRRTRTELDERGVATIRWTFRLVCLREACRPQPGRSWTFRFPPVQVSFRRRDGRPRVRRSQWHALRSMSRLSASEASREAFSARQHPLPPVTYRVEPGTLANGVLVPAALLALVGAGLLWRTFSGIALGRLARSRLARLDVVQRQLAVLRDAVARSDAPAQRRALDGLSLSLGGNGDGTDELAVGARRLAWSPRHGSSEDVLGFAEQVEQTVEPGRRR